MNGGRLRSFAASLQPGSLRFQLLSRTLLILAALLLVVGVFQYVIMKQFLYQNRAEAVRSQLASIPRIVWQAAEDGGLREDRIPMLFIPNVSVAFMSAEGDFQVILQDPEAGIPPAVPPEEASEAVRQRGAGGDYLLAEDEKGTKLLIVLEPIRSRGGLIGVAQLSLNTAPMDAELQRQLRLFIGLSVAAMLLGLLTFVPVLNRALIPLSRIIARMERTDSQSLHDRLPAESKQSEIDRLAGAFNRMLERLEQSFAAEKEAKEQMRRFVADASHELRTPLTSIHGFLEVLLRGAARNPEQLERSLRSMHSESRRLNKLVHDLLQLARLDRSPPLDAAPGSLSELVLEMEPQLRLLAEDREVSLSLEPDAAGSFDADKLKQVILNLFQNAVQVTDPHTGRIAVTTSRTADGLMLEVTDNGPGMSEEQLASIFERFYRIDTSRSRLYGGAGLGLAISQSIVELHNGRIHVASVPGGGSSFTVSLPSDS